MRERTVKLHIVRGTIELEGCTKFENLRGGIFRDLSLGAPIQ